MLKKSPKERPFASQLNGHPAWDKLKSSQGEESIQNNFTGDLSQKYTFSVNKNPLISRPEEVFIPQSPLPNLRQPAAVLANEIPNLPDNFDDFDSPLHSPMKIQSRLQGKDPAKLNIILNYCAQEEDGLI